VQTEKEDVGDDFVQISTSLQEVCYLWLVCLFGYSFKGELMHQVEVFTDQMSVASECDCMVPVYIVPD
jgi:hypothetical protein